jgi:hypothetical protein
LLKNRHPVCVGLKAGAAKRCVRQQQRDEIMRHLVMQVKSTSRIFSAAEVLLKFSGKLDKKQSCWEELSYYQGIKKAR